jgi:hypothetical protein
MKELLSSSRKVTWKAENSEAGYALIAAVLKAQRYRKLDKPGKGIVRRFPQKVTATSRAQCEFPAKVRNDGGRPYFFGK